MNSRKTPSFVHTTSRSVLPLALAVAATLLFASALLLMGLPTARAQSTIDVVTRIKS